MNLAKALEIASATHTGMVRSHNEDAIATDGSIGLVVLADGMGGYNAGEVASGIAVALITSEMRQAVAKTSLHALSQDDGDNQATRLLRGIINKTNTSIYESANSQPQYAGMGTTLVVALYRDNRMSVAHIGDSRLYRLRNEKLEQVTRDHSLLQEQIDSGMLTKEAARRSQNKNLVTRALGIEPEVEAEIHTYDVQPGDIYLLCSDGLNDMVEDDDIELTLNAMGSNLPLAANQLVQMANDNGGRDNVSVVLVKVSRDFPAADTWLSRVLSWFK
ncbi:MAG: Stp1/IreP family PP2C-type Ser/Thr phosphatase [Betaproteobacteria bacterium]|nr:Stp1/IreP family PP2C-type Ser/Thr phosphatase [Betaproteobacteria bacterium]MBL8534254.1 Stp1/IreP family PP2C-type Ser/Thr phosphatase [Betaproteobacteria bacterium]